jgi:hypothetical protein
VVHSHKGGIFGDLSPDERYKVNQKVFKELYLNTRDPFMASCFHEYTKNIINNSLYRTKKEKFILFLVLCRVFNLSRSFVKNLVKNK